MKLKTYLALAVRLHTAMRPEHVAANGDTQATILVRARSMKAFSDALNKLFGGTRDNTRHLREYGGIHEVFTVGTASSQRGIRAVSDIVKKDDTVYYERGYSGEWFEARPHDEDPAGRFGDVVLAAMVADYKRENLAK